MRNVEMFLVAPTATSAFARIRQHRRPSIPPTLTSTDIPKPSCSTLAADGSSTPLDNFKYHLKTLHLFTFSDLKNILYPQSLLALVLTSANTPISTLLTRLPQTVGWIWLHLLFFVLSNQGSAIAVEEDRLNKPWRPIPAGRITLTSARRLRWIVMTICVLYSILLGAGKESVLLMSLMIMYNDLGGDQHGLNRAWLNAAGYGAFALGGVTILSAGQGLRKVEWVWFAYLTAVIATTGQCQDLEDIEGDILRGRKTVPIMIGENLGRWSVMLGMGLWTMGAWAIWWEGKVVGAVLVGIMCVAVMERLLRAVNKIGEQRVKTYKGAFRLWSVWLAGLYILPLFSR